MTVNERHREYPAQGLTGSRRQQGSLASGLPNYTYEVMWNGTDANGSRFTNTWEPAANLIGWEAEIARVDQARLTESLQPQINPARLAQQGRLKEARVKFTTLLRHQDWLKRRMQRHEEIAAQMNGNGDAPTMLTEDGNESQSECDDADPEVALSRADELVALAQRVFAALDSESASDSGLSSEKMVKHLLAALADNADDGASARLRDHLQPRERGRPAAVCVPEPLVQDPVREQQQEAHQIGGALQYPRLVRSPAWQFFYETTDQAGVSCVKCKLCDQRPPSGTGTSGIWKHLEKCHAKERMPLQNEVIMSP